MYESYITLQNTQEDYYPAVRKRFLTARETQTGHRFSKVRQRWRAVDECVASLGVAAISDRGELVVGVRLVRQQCLI